MVMPSHARPSVKICRTDSKTQSPIYLGLDPAEGNGMRDQTEFMVARRALLHYSLSPIETRMLKQVTRTLYTARAQSVRVFPRFLV